MTDPVSTARTARENLARGLAALQGPGVPPALMDVAEPVAEAMSALHRVEASHGGALGEAAPSALQAVRRALGMLQSQPLGIAAVDQAMEAVAGSLSLVHTLNQLLVSSPAAPVAPAPPIAAAPANPLGATVALGDAYPQARAPAPAPQAAYPAQPGFAPGAPTTAYGPPPNAYPAPAAAPGWPSAPQPQMPMQQPMQQQPMQQQPMQQAPMQQAPMHQAPMQQPGAQPIPAIQQPVSPWTQTAPAAPAAHAASQQALGSAPQHAAPPPGSAPYHAPPAPIAAPPDAMRVEAELGAHSATNFYKGLSGNDVIDSGGIFIATYKIPEIGQNLVIRVSLPGGYEFEALGVVQWTRDAPQSTAGNEVPPGFGARFTQITPEGRQLVYRYVRNREPLFHDDL